MNRFGAWLRNDPEIVERSDGLFAIRRRRLWTRDEYLDAKSGFDWWTITSIVNDRCWSTFDVALQNLKRIQEQKIVRGSVPASRVVEVEALTGVSRKRLRPDLYAAAPARKQVAA